VGFSRNMRHSMLSVVVERVPRIIGSTRLKLEILISQYTSCLESRIFFFKVSILTALPFAESFLYEDNSSKPQIIF
jgi:hypothetical protein